MDDLFENEHPLSTPDLIGDDNEKINCIHYWSEIVGLLRSLNTTVVSHPNKTNLIAAIRKELELIEIELQNETSQAVQNADGSMDMQQVGATEDGSVVIDLTHKEEAKTIELKRIQRESLDRLARAAGVHTPTNKENWARKKGSK